MRKSSLSAVLAMMFFIGTAACASETPPLQALPDPSFIPSEPAAGKNTPWQVRFGPAENSVIELVDNEVIRIPPLSSNAAVEWQLAEPPEEELTRATIERTSVGTDMGSVFVFWGAEPLAKFPPGNAVRASVTFQFDGDDWFPLWASGNSVIYSATLSP